MGKIICPKCKETSDRLHRYNSGNQWMCPTCYVGMYCHPTPQTQWPEPSTDNVLTEGDDFKIVSEYLNREFKRILYRMKDDGVITINKIK